MEKFGLIRAKKTCDNSFKGFIIFLYVLFFFFLFLFSSLA